MSAIRWKLNDPTLFLFTSFACHPALDDPAARPEERRQQVHKVLECVHWIPKKALDKALLPDWEVDHLLRRHWQDPAGDPRLSDNWAVTTFGISYHETLGVLLGVEQSGLCTTSPAEWLTHARTCWTSTFETNGRWPPPKAFQDGDVVGRAWVWTGEWGAPPAEGWEHFGRDEYPDGCVVFPWGLLGYRAPATTMVAAGNDGLGRFELHVAHGDEDLKKRDIFLLTALIVILTDFMKVTDYIWRSYMGSAHRQLLRGEKTIMMKYDPERKQMNNFLNPRKEVTIKQLQDLNNIIFLFTRRLGNLKHDLLSVNIARDTIHSQLEAHKGRILPGAYGTHFVANVDWVAAQMASDIAYFDTAKQCGNAIMWALRLKAEVENTEAEHRMLFASLVIADLIIGVTAVVGVWTIAHDIITEQVTTEHVREIVTILVSAGISLLVGCLTIYLCWKSLRLLLPERYRKVRTWLKDD